MLNPEVMLEEEGIECLTPDLPREIIGDINISPSLSRYKEELVRGARAQYELAILRQRKIKESADRIERCYMDGIGRRVASIDLEMFLRLELSWGRGWWRDGKTLAKVVRENPFLGIRCLPAWSNGRSFSVRVNGLKKSGGQRSEVSGQKLPAETPAATMHSRRLEIEQEHPPSPRLRRTSEQEKKGLVLCAA